MENAFNKVLEMNHKHVSVRFNSAVNLLSNVFIKSNSRATHSVFYEMLDINSYYESVRSSSRDMFMNDKMMYFDRNRSPTPKFTHSQNINKHISPSLQDSTIFLTRVQEKYRSSKSKRRRQNKSVDRSAFMF